MIRIPFASLELVNAVISNDKLNWLDACCQYYFDLIHLGFSHGQVMTMALCNRGDEVMHRVVNSFALLQSLGFSVGSIYCLAQCDQAHDSMNRVVQSAPFFQQEGVPADSLLAILNSKNVSQNLEMLIDSYPILKPFFKKELLLEWASRSDGAQFLRSKRELLLRRGLCFEPQFIER